MQHKEIVGWEGPLNTDWLKADQPPRAEKSSEGERDNSEKKREGASERGRKKEKDRQKRKTEQKSDREKRQRESTENTMLTDKQIITRSCEIKHTKLKLKYGIYLMLFYSSDNAYVMSTLV